MKPKEARELGPFEAAREALKGFEFGAAGWSDRDAVLSAAATAEALLQIILMSYFARHDKMADEALTRTLIGLRARIDVAYCIGAIDQELAAGLRDLAKIRNAFAHNITVWQLSDERVRPDLRKLGVPDSISEFAPLHKEFVLRAEGILSRLYQVALFIWWKEGTLPVLCPPSAEQWRRVLETDLSVLDELDSDSLDSLGRFGIVSVEDVLSVKNSPLIDALGPEAHDLILCVHLWVVSELYPSGG